jgi:type III restriction enzyme
MESETRIRALASLYPLFALRYSATHRNPYNLAYRLTPFEAYRQGLVKKIELASIVKEDDFNQVFVRVDSYDESERRGAY